MNNEDLLKTEKMIVCWNCFRRQRNRHCRIGVFRDLVSLTRFTEEERDYSLKMYEAACLADSINKRYESLFFISRYYCNTFQLDSLTYWVSKFDSIITVRKEYPVIIFDS